MELLTKESASLKDCVTLMFKHICKVNSSQEFVYTTCVHTEMLHVHWCTGIRNRAPPSVCTYCKLKVILFYFYLIID